MTTDPLDFGATLAAKSDQLNADDIPAPVTVQIIGASVTGGNQEQPVLIKLSGGHMPWKPCKGMRRLLAEIAGSTSLKPWLGKWLRLYRDPEVKWAGKPAGGIRLLGVDSTMLPKTRKFRVRSSRQGYTEYRIESLRAPQQEGAPTADLDALLADEDLTRADVDRWRAANDKGPLSELDETQVAKVAAWFAGDPSRLNQVRALIPQD